MYEEPSALEAEGAERVNRLEAEERPPFAGRRAAARGRGELEAPAEVERQDAETLPRAVGRIAHRGDAAEGEPAFELAVHLLVDPAPAHERPEGAAVDGLVRDDGAVLVVPVVRVEEVELEVLRRLVPDVAAERTIRQRRCQQATSTVCSAQVTSSVTRVQVRVWSTRALSPSQG